MANEFQHKSVGTELTQAEYEAVGGHEFDSQATGDLPYASGSAQISRLAVGATSTFLQVVGGIPAWVASPTLVDDALLQIGTTADTVILNRSTSLAADAELSNVIEGTSDHLGVAANSLIISNITNDSDIMFAVSDNGNSIGLLKLDGADGKVYVHGPLDVSGTLTGNRSSVYIQPHALANTGTLSAFHTDYGVTIIGSSSADGSAVFTLRVPSDFATLTALKICGKADGGGAMYYMVEADYGGTGQSHTTHTGAIGTGANVIVVDNQAIDIDISAVAGSLAANDNLGVEFIREGSHGSDAINNFKVYGLILEYTT